MTIRKGGKGRDEELFKSLYGKYYRRVIRFYVVVFRVSEEDARDLAQDVFIRFYEAMEEYRGDAEWAFLETIARRVGLNRVRAFKTAKRDAKIVNIDDPREFTEPAIEDADYAELQLAELQRKQLYAAIETLPPGQKQCVVLFLADMKYGAIARALRISEDAVKSRLRDARRELRERLGVVLPEVEE